MTPEQLLAQLGLAMNLPGLALDANGCARLMVDGRIAVNFEVDEGAGGMQIYSTLAPLPAQEQGAMLLMLLEGNLFGAQTLGATLAVDTLYNEIVLCRAIAVRDMSAPDFTAIVERFVTAVQEWTQKLSAGAPAPAATATGEDTLKPEAIEPRAQAHFLRV